MAAKNDSSLTEKQQRFIEEYIVDLNGSQAVIRAGYSKNSAKEIASELLTKPHIQEAIKKSLDARSKRTEITADMVLAELGRIGFSNISNYLQFNASGVEMYDSSKMTDDALRCVAEVSETVTQAGGTVKFKMHDKVGALEKIARHLGMFNDRLNIGGQVDNPLQLGGKIEIELIRPDDK